MSSLMSIRVTRESIISGFLPEGNYMTINGKAYPLGTFALRLSEGSYQIDIYSPALASVRRVDHVLKSNQMLILDLVVNGSGNVVEAEIFSTNMTAEQVDDFLKLANQTRLEIEEWQRNNNPTPTSKPKTESTSNGLSGGKAIGWGLIIMLLFGIGIVLCCTGNIEIEKTAITDNFSLSNLAVYIVGAIIGAITFLSGLLIRSVDA